MTLGIIQNLSLFFKFFIKICLDGTCNSRMSYQGDCLQYRGTSGNGQGKKLKLNGDPAATNKDQTVKNSTRPHSRE